MRLRRFRYIWDLIQASEGIEGAHRSVYDKEEERLLLDKINQEINRRQNEAAISDKGAAE
jgi:hypothetical protein